MHRAAALAFVLLSGCSDSGTEPSANDEPPAVWTTTTDTTDFAGSLIASADAELRINSATFLSFGCAITLDAGREPSIGAEIGALTSSFSDPPFIVTHWHDGPVWSPGWIRGFQGRYASVATDDVNQFAQRALAADSIRFGWSDASDYSERVFDTRALDDAFEVLDEVCGWVP